MIVPFAVDPEALLMSAADSAVRRSTHRRLLELWDEVGVLVHDGADLRKSALVQTIQRLPQDVRKLWQAAIERHRKAGVADGWRHFCDLGSCDELAALREHFRLACLEAKRAVCLGLPYDGVSVVLEDGGVEVCRFDCADQSEAFRRAQKLAKEGISKGARVEDVWEERFADLARVSRHIVVVDRYTAQRHANGTGAPTGLRALLTRLAIVPGEKLVKIYSGCKSEAAERERANAVEALAKAIAGGSVREVRLFLARDKQFAEEAHDRFIRFDKALCELGSGMEVFEGSTVGRACTFSLKTESKISKETEKGLRDVSKEWTFPLDHGLR